MDRSKALKLFCYCAKKEFCPILEHIFEIADYSIFKVDSIFDVLMHNATTNDTSENGTRSFEAEYNMCHPSPRLVRYRLEGLKLAEIEHALQEGNERILSLAQKQRMFKNPVVLSIDMTHTPCYGKRKKHACGTKEFKGTKYGYRYASVVVSMNGVRFTLHTVCMTQFTKKPEILETLIEKARKYVKIRILLVDRGFFNILCIKKLEELHVTYLMPVINIVHTASEEQLTLPFLLHALPNI